MSNKHNRDAGSGKYVSQQFADEHKGETVSETAPDISRLLSKLTKGGGAIVSVADLGDDDIAQARKEGRISGAFVYVPIEG